VSLRELIGTLRRRWVVLAVGWFVTLVACWVATHPTPVYKAVTVITLRAPRNGDLPNQFSDGRPSIALTGALISARLKSRSGEAELRRAGVVGKYALTPRNSGTSATPAYLIASIEVTTQTGSARSALAGLRAIVTTFQEELDGMQAEWGVAPSDWIRVATLAPASASRVQVLTSRALLGMGAFGVSATIALALWLDPYLSQWRGPSASRGSRRPRLNLTPGRRLARR
jgi:hypothetical protein